MYKRQHYERAQKYLPMGTSGVMSIDIKGGRAPAMKFMDSLKLACNEVHVADIRTCVLHPAVSYTHLDVYKRQLIRRGRYRSATHVVYSTQAQHDCVAQSVSLEFTHGTYGLVVWYKLFSQVLSIITRSRIARHCYAALCGDETTCVAVCYL